MKIYSHDARTLTRWLGEGFFSGLLLIMAITESRAQDLTYATNTGSITITGYTGSGGSIMIPDMINGMPVTSIASLAFVNEILLRSVTIPMTVTNIGDSAFNGCIRLATIKMSNGLITIGDSAFRYSGITNVIIPGSVNRIGNYSFATCGALASVSFGAGLTTIPEGAFFDDGGLLSVSIPDAVQIIGNRAFESSGLTQVIIGSKVTTIGDHAFRYSDLTDVLIPSAVTNIGLGPFASTKRLTTIRVDPLNTNYVDVAGVLFSRDLAILIQYPGGTTGAYTVPDQVKVVADYAFTGCSLSVVSLPGSVTTIGNWAFAYSPLASITVPDSVTQIGDWAFGDCSSLTNLIIGNGVASIGAFAFSGCTALTNLKIPDSVAMIGDDAFENDYNLTNLTLSQNLRSIPNELCYFCGSLTRITLPQGVTNIGSSAFADTALTAVTIPRSVAYLGDLSFTGCPVLSAVYFEGDAPTVGTNVFENYVGPPGPAGRGFDPATVFYRPGTSGWSATLGGLPAVLWNPQIVTAGNNFGVRSNLFGFNVVGTAGIPLLIEASTDLAAGVWASLQTCNLTNGLIYFNDSTWTNSSSRFYRIRSP